jgi:lipid II:glycine glycyltransferase (peptidoglycan interpeptide bridge formation enzyme)
VTYLYGGHLPLFPDVMASYALHWHLMREAAAEGYRVYDFYGYVPADRPDHPYDGFSRFKEKFGGRHVPRIGSRDVVFYDRLADAALRAMRAAPGSRPLARAEAP